MTLTAKPVFKYFDIRPVGPLGGRGNNIRCYMLANKMPFDEELVSFADWGAGEKAKCTAEQNPAGHLPVLIVGDKSYVEHVSIVRYLARKNGQYGNDPEMDFVADAAADAYQEWRNAWATTVGEPETSEKVKAYRDTRDKYYPIMEWHYSKKASPSSPFLTGGATVGFADATVYNMLRDCRTLHSPVDLSPYPNLKALFEAVSSIPEVKAWETSWEESAKK